MEIANEPDDGLETSKWRILYPNYINSKKTQEEGRRIAAAQAAEHPHAAEMAEICEYLKIPHVLEMDKAYPRDWLIKGRIRIMLKTPEGAWAHPEIHTKKDVMLKMGELIPKLKSRVAGPQAVQQQAASAGSGAAPNKTAKKEAKREEKKANKKQGKK
mmetsp:Transcript_19622/g.55170  ORF Transcript_19622/g.55170 Transcript_19622/m.55170 type:complete len:158 (-) Transcript_19622:57-530(-)|eukprot:CAMPEP_0179299408 /NCGR_PEP_ID=MMETSP0797-20121207/46501_1 /TAXON_ID=47934 /ORGANISM="Dinophysis acuminata, Strain DAEP01" /LENGTH=157 /DNA_ID=CAMNT_0021008841 /DNA_START=28 /DNA_END=501 /DNA_ORIENTATION=+